VVLSRDLAARNQYPAIDVLASVSRLMVDVASPRHLAAAGEFKSLLATYRDAEDLVNIGAYQRGSNPRIDRALEMIEPMRAFLQQGIYERADYGEIVAQLQSLFPVT